MRLGPRGHAWRWAWKAGMEEGQGGLKGRIWVGGYGMRAHIGIMKCEGHEGH
jgi:hypothetical protein